MPPCVTVMATQLIAKLLQVVQIVKMIAVMGWSLASTVKMEPLANNVNYVKAVIFVHQQKI